MTRRRLGLIAASSHHCGTSGTSSPSTQMNEQRDNILNLSIKFVIVCYEL